ncbi:MAG: class I SAM-dependent methyltransferase [Dehalococcoidia bacterium]|nr:class I SAM-dependent methyltransferase [Dehalococcoidia bacterium]MCB9483234.1 class I SAM-dependent methyltransferase [Dehalococcoidia bacterium]
MERDPFAEIAEFYDLDFEDFHDDASFYERLVELHGQRVLELGIGTGRIATPLAEAGAKVTGVDVSAGMLEVARERAGGLPITFVEGDIRAVKLRGRFDIVIAPLGTLQHMETPSDFVAALETMARHLAEGGIAVIDVESPVPDDFDPSPQPVIQHWTKPWRDGRVTKLVSVDAIPSEGTKEVTWHYDIAAADGALRRVTSVFPLRTFTSPEIELGARLAGLRIAARFGDYEFGPYFDGAERLIVILQREDDEVGYVYGEDAIPEDERGLRDGAGEDEA